MGHMTPAGTALAYSLMLKSSHSRTPQEKAAETARWAETLFRALVRRAQSRRWRFVSFRGDGGGEWRGVVDVLAVRKDTSQPANKSLKRGDLFDVVLVQLKGGASGWPTVAEKRRLRAVGNRYAAQSVVLFLWKRRKECSFYRLSCRATGNPVLAAKSLGDPVDADQGASPTTRACRPR